MSLGLGLGLGNSVAVPLGGATFVIPDPRFICLAPLNNNLSRRVPLSHDGMEWSGVAEGEEDDDDCCGNSPSSCLLIYCASAVRLRSSSSLEA